MVTSPRPRAASSCLSGPSHLSHMTALQESGPGPGPPLMLRPAHPFTARSGHAFWFSQQASQLVRIPSISPGGEINKN